jgi:hypothetical protein
VRIINRDVIARSEATGYVDGDLRKIFRKTPARSDIQKNYLPASDFIREHRPFLIHRISLWVRADPLAAKDLVDKYQHRAKELRLSLLKREKEYTLLELVSYLSQRCVLYRSTGSYFE